jgi:hypothetical protein
VTISIIKAELLSLLQGIKKDQYIKHLPDKLNISLDKQQIQIHCNNYQTIYLVTKEIACLQIKL